MDLGTHLPLEVSKQHMPKPPAMFQKALQAVLKPSEKL